MTVAELMVKLGLDSTDFTKGWEDANKLFGDSASETTQALSGFSTLASNLTSLGAVMSGAITAPFAALAAASVSSAGTFESLENALTTITKDSTETANQMERLKEVAKLPGLGLEEAVQGSIRLQNAGMAAQDAERYLRLFGNAIAAAGGGAADLDAVTMQLMQMSSKSKVVAGDLKPIMERVPQMASIVKEAFGTLDTEQLQKMGVSTQEFLRIVTDNLELIPPVTGGVKNAFENMGDSAKVTLAKIGENFIPVMETISGLVESFLGKVGGFADWFGSLPAPIQVAVGSLATFAAAIGPIIATLGIIGSTVTAAMPALTGMATFFGTTVAALGGWALAVAGIVAALAGLGTWVYQNWEPIKATVSAAWEGLSELWDSEWTQIVNGITGWWNGLVELWDTVMEPFKLIANALWDGITDAWSGIWSVIGPTVTGAWDVIKSAYDTILTPLANAVGAVWDSATSLWNTVWTTLKGYVSSAIEGIIEWINKIPGAQKLMKLDDVWKEAQKLKDESKAIKDATKEAGTAAKNAGTDWAKHAAELEKNKTKQKKSKELTWEQQVAMLALRQEIAEFRMTNRFFVNSFKEVNDKAIQVSIEKADKAVTSLADFGVKLAEAGTKGKDTNIALSPLLTTLNEMKTPTDDLATALNDLGIQSATSYQAVADNAKKAYDKVVQSEKATEFEKNSALRKVLEAQVAAAKAAGETIPAEWGKMIEDLEQKTSTKLPTVEKPWGDFKNNVSTVITNFAQDIGKSLFDGETSWGEKMKNMLTSLGSAVTSSFIEPAAKAISDFITGALTKLLSGDGLGGISNVLTTIGGKITDIFSGTKKVTDAVGGAAGAAGGVGSGIGGVVSGGIMGTIGAIGSAVSAVSGIIGNFQNARQENTLNAIEKEVRYSQIHLNHLLENSNLYDPWLENIAGRLWYFTGNGLGVVQFDQANWRFSQLDDIKSAIENSTGSSVTINADEDGVNVLNNVFSKVSIGIESLVSIGQQMTSIFTDAFGSIKENIFRISENVIQQTEVLRAHSVQSAAMDQEALRHLGMISASPRNIVNVTVNVDNADSRRIADEIVENLRLQGVMA